MSTASRKKTFIAAPNYSSEPDFIIHSAPTANPVFDENNYRTGKFSNIREVVERVEFFLPLNADRERFIKVDLSRIQLKRIMDNIDAVESLTIDPEDFESYAAD